MKRTVCIMLLLCCALLLPAQQAQSDRLYKARVGAKIAELSFEDKSALWFSNADTGLPLSGMEVNIEKVGVVVTDGDGLAIFSTPSDGYYSFATEKPGFMTIKDQFSVLFGSVLFNRYSVPPAAPLGYVKIVLDWGKDPADLDIHLVKENHYHISYRDTIKAQDGTAWLDRDCVTGYGPETVTITQTDNNAVYKIYIHNYTNRNQSNSSVLSQSKAVIRIYNNNRLEKTLAVEPGHPGVYWEAFEITRGTIRLINNYR